MPVPHHAWNANLPPAAIYAGPRLEDGHHCKICGVIVPYAPGSITAHFLSETHQAHARELGVYCSCGREFLNPANFPYHKCMSPSIKRPEIAAFHELNACEICRVVFRSQDYLKQHRDSQQHLDRAKELGYRCVCVRFFSDLGTMERHRCFDKAMINQAGSIGSGMVTLPRPRLNCTGCEMGFFSEAEFFAYHKGYKGVHSPVWVTPPEDACAHVNTCQLCDVNLYQRGSLRAHQKMQSHIDLLILKGLQCPQCKMSFTSGAAAQEHWSRAHDPNGPTEFRCCDCQARFRTSELLTKHACRCAPPEGYHACEPCNRKFPRKRELILHLNSKNHKPVKCLGGGGCAKKFKDLPGMLQHLESGHCKSKMNRKKIDALLKKHDTANTITIKGVQPLIPTVLPPPPAASRTPFPMAVIDEVEMYLPRKDPGGPSLDPAPTASLPRGSRVDPLLPQTPPTVAATVSQRPQRLRSMPD